MKKQVITVSQITNAISRMLDEGIGSVAVQGEISNFKAHSSGHRYFTLKDEGAQISCTMWRSRTLSFMPTNGMKVIVSGKLTVYPPRGQYQIECSSIKPIGQGDLYLAFEALKEELEEMGYFDLERKREIPLLPRNIGLSTSPTGAAVKDIISTIERRFPACNIYFRPTLVQGENAADDIVDAISELEKTPAEIIIIGRGGGSLEDLWAFNMKSTADAIFHSKLPIISAVGHETDFTIADFVADIRAATPTAAAEFVTPVPIDLLLQNIHNAKINITNDIFDKINGIKEKLDSYSSSYVFKRIKEKVRTYQQQNDELESRLIQATKRNINRLKEKLLASDGHFKSLYPLSPLDKGFALLKSNDWFITKDETLGNYIEVDIIRKNEIVRTTITKVNKAKNNKSKR